MKAPPPFIVESRGITLTAALPHPDANAQIWGRLVIDGTVQEKGGCVYYYKGGCWHLSHISLTWDQVTALSRMLVGDFIGQVDAIEITETLHHSEVRSVVSIYSVLFPSTAAWQVDQLSTPAPGLMPAFAENRTLLPAFALPPQSLFDGEMVKRSVSAQCLHQFVYREWDNPWSVQDWQRYFEQGVARTTGMSIGIPLADNGGIERVLDHEATIEDAFWGTRVAVDDLMTVATKTARDQLDQGRLIHYFEFSSEARAAFQQYLAYFSQFLRDLDVTSPQHRTQSA